MPSKLYTAIIKTADRFVPNFARPVWEHPAGPKTIFFWAPLGKWGLVLAGLGDINRPVEKLSVRQSLSLMVSCCIWSRWSLIIIPKNYSLFAVNVFVVTTSLYQLARIYVYQKKLAEEEERMRKQSGCVRCVCDKSSECQPIETSPVTGRLRLSYLNSGVQLLYRKALVLASLDAYTRPLDKVSVTQSATLSATGIIWTRYCLVITPVNYSLAVCNFMLGVANGVQTVRAYSYQSKMESAA